jgi:hypothetical protein
VGGVHMVGRKPRSIDQEIFELQKELSGKLHHDGLDGLYGELLAMGQAIGRSPDLLSLAQAIREKAQPEGSVAQPPESE